MILLFKIIGLIYIKTQIQRSNFAYLSKSGFAVVKLLPNMQQIYYGWGNIKTYEKSIYRVLETIKLDSKEPFDTKSKFILKKV